MADLNYIAITSLDGYVADQDGDFSWSMPDEEVHVFVNDLARPVGTYLYVRRLYDVMLAWETMDVGPEQSPVARDFAQLWKAADKIVYSRTLATVSTPRTRVEPSFDLDAVRQLKGSADRDMSIGGPELAAQAISGGLVDDFHLLVSPVVVGGGKLALPSGAHLSLDLIDERRFGNGVVHLHYRPRA